MSNETEKMETTALEYHENLVEKAKGYIEDNFQNAISLSSIADHCNVSHFHFSRLFKKLTGVSPYQYLLNIRLTHAESLLKNTAQSIMEICFASGFNSVEHFSTAFKSKYGKNPRTYRQQVSKGRFLPRKVPGRKPSPITNFFATRVAIQLSEDHLNQLFTLVINGVPGHRVVLVDDWDSIIKHHDHVDFIITDFKSSGSRALDVFSSLRYLKPDSKILMLSDCTDPAIIAEALKAGIAGFLSKKEASPQAVLQALGDIGKGGTPLSSDVSKLLVQRISPDPVSANRKDMKFITCL